MPAFLEKKLKAEYPKDPAAPYKIMNSIGAMKGNKITPKGRAMEAKHAAHIDRGHKQVVNRSSHGEKLRHG